MKRTWFALYLRWTVDLLPFLLPLLGPFFFGGSSLQTKTEDQEDDSDLHSAER